MDAPIDQGEWIDAPVADGEWVDAPVTSIETIPEPNAEFNQARNDIVKFVISNPMFAMAAGKGIEQGTSELKAGFEQAGFRLLEKIGIIQPGYTKQFTDKTVQELAAKENQYAPWYRDNFGFEVGKFGAKAAPWMLLPAGQFGTWGNALYSATVGGAAGATTFASSEEKANANIMMGIAFGAGISLGGSLLSKVPTWYRDHVYKQGSVTKEWQEGEQIVQGMRDRGYGSFDLHVGELTNLPSSQTAETATVQSKFFADKFYQEKVSRVNQATDLLDKTISRYAKGADKPEVIASQVKSAFDSWKSNAVAARARAWDTTFGQIDDITNGSRFIRVSETNAKIQELKNELNGRMTPKRVKDAILPDLLELESKLAPRQKGRFTGNDLLSAKEMQGTLSEYRMLKETAENASDVAANIRARFYREVYKSLDKDLAAAETTVKGPAAELLRTARTNYAKDSQYIDNFTASTIGKILDDPSFSPTVLAEKLPSLDYPTAKLMVDNLRTSDPSVMRKVGGVMIRNVMKNSKPEAGSLELVIDPKKFIANLPDDKMVNLLFGTSKGKAEMKLAVDALNRLAIRLKTNPQLQFSEEAQRTSSSLAGGQQSLVFQVALAVKTGFPKTLEKLSTVEGREAIKVALNPKSSADYVAALTVIYGDDPDVRKLADDMNLIRREQTKNEQQ